MNTGFVQFFFTWKFSNNFYFRLNREAVEAGRKFHGTDKEKEKEKEKS